MVQINNFFSKVKKETLGIQAPWSERVSKVFSGAIALISLYWVFLLITTPFYVKQMRESVPQVVLDEEKELPALQELASYQEVVNQHPVFGVLKQTASAPARSACDDFQSKYSLAGIVGGVENEALFNSKSGKQTYFARAGEVLEGVNVESVGAHSVMLDCSGKKVEMMIEET